MHIYDLMNGARLTELVRDGYINMALSPPDWPEPYVLYNYTLKTTFERVWTPETRQCRGLVTDTSGNVVCLPLAKFWNAFEWGIPDVTPEALAAWGNTFEVTDKIDGSMVACWYDDVAGRWRCTTRGSFASTQAQAAQAWLDARADWESWPKPGYSSNPEQRFTFVGEWCAPDNRVVLRYEQPELRLIGVRMWDDKRTGDLPHFAVASWAEELGLSAVPRIENATLDNLTARAQSEAGIEGWVLRWGDKHNAFRVKVKTADYIRLHKALSGFGPKQVYEVLALCNPDAWDAYEQGLPEEILPDALRYADTMHEAVINRAESLAAVFNALSPLLYAGRREFALAVQRECPPADRPIIFALADSKDCLPLLWKQLDYRALFGAEAAEPIVTPDDN